MVTNEKAKQHLNFDALDIISGINLICIHITLFNNSIFHTSRIAREASASLRKEFRNAVSGSYSKIVSLSRVGSGNVDQLNRQSSGQGSESNKAIEISHSKLSICCL